jgi:hypothetical protein
MVPSLPELEVLLDRLLTVAFAARDQHIAKKMDVYAALKTQVEGLLQQVRTLYKQDSGPFNRRILRDIRTAKICARIITRADLDREEEERERQDVIAAHATFLRRQGMEDRGTRSGLGHHRITHCYNCKHHLDNTIDVECVGCGWIICSCGACGCGYSDAG